MKAVILYSPGTLTCQGKNGHIRPEKNHTPFKALIIDLFIGRLFIANLIVPILIMDSPSDDGTEDGKDQVIG